MRLEQIAQKMIQNAREFNNHHPTLYYISQHRLPRGLCLSLALYPSATTPRWELVISRAEVDPSDHEIRICREVFGIPGTATESGGVVVLLDKGDTRYSKKINWLNVSQLKLL